MSSKPNSSLIRDFSASGLSLLSPHDRIQAWLNMSHHPSFTAYDKSLLQHVTLLSASEGKCEFELTITPDMCNAAGNLHGGCAATLLDDLTSMPAHTIAKEGFLDGGTVSRTLTCTYLKAVKPGEKVRVRCEVVGAGRTLCHFRGDLITEDGKVAVSCVHDKVPRPKEKL